VNNIGLEEFIEKYEKPYLPVVIQGASEDWLANEKWTPQVIAN
jgi:histone arginine demethylase JMJD6